MDAKEILELESKIVEELKTVFDPEIPVNVYDLGLIYELDVQSDGKTKVIMTLTAPNCPMADQLISEVQEKVKSVKGVKEVDFTLTFDPPWDKNMLSEEAKLDLGLL